MTLVEMHAQLRAALAPVGIEVGPDVLALWRDREAHGTEPVPPEALRRIAEVSRQLAECVPAA